MTEKKRTPRRIRGIVLLLALAAFATPAGAGADSDPGTVTDGWVRAVRYVGCAIGAFTSVIRADGAVMTQSLLFCAQLLNDESA